MKKNQNARSSKKNKKLDGNQLVDVCVPHEGVHLWKTEEHSTIELVADGEDASNHPLSKPPIMNSGLP